MPTKTEIRRDDKKAPHSEECGAIQLGQISGLIGPYTRAMTIGEKLLKLSAEYQRETADRESGAAEAHGFTLGREPSAIAAEYEAALKELLVRQDV